MPLQVAATWAQFDLSRRKLHDFSLMLQRQICQACAVTSYDALFLGCLFQGNLVDFLRLTGWRGSKVLYFGDHLYSDLAVSYKLGGIFVLYSTLLVHFKSVLNFNL